MATRDNDNSIGISMLASGNCSSWQNLGRHSFKALSSHRNTKRIDDGDDVGNSIDFVTARRSRIDHDTIIIHEWFEGKPIADGTNTTGYS